MLASFQELAGTFQHVMWEHTTHSNRGEDTEYTTHCDKNVPCSQEGCSQATTQRNYKRLENKHKYTLVFINFHLDPTVTPSDNPHL